MVSEKPVTKSHFIGLLLENCPQSIANHAEVVLPEGSPILVYQISSTCTRVLVDVKGSVPKDVRQYLKEIIYPEMPGEYY